VGRRFVVLLGPPGAGKGTQAARLAERTGLAHVASGDLFREHLARGSELGKLAQAYMSRGELVPDEVTIRMIAERLGQPDAASGAIFDGFPRTVPQAEALDRLLAAYGERVDRAVVIDVARDELIRRLTGRWLCRQCQTPYHEASRPPRVPGRCDVCGGELYQRPDDTAEVVERRLAVYEEQTRSLLDWYGRASVLVRVNGQQDITAVQQDLARVVAG
jgi:adenylate kinase